MITEIHPMTKKNAFNAAVNFNQLCNRDMEIHNFAVGDVVNVLRINPFSEDRNRYVEGRAIIVSLEQREDTYKVKFERAGKFEGRKFVRYVDPNQEVTE